MKKKIFLQMWDWKMLMRVVGGRKWRCLSDLHGEIRSDPFGQQEDARFEKKWWLGKNIQMVYLLFSGQIVVEEEFQR